MRYCIAYGLIALALAGLALSRGGLWLGCLWPALNAAILSVGYGTHQPAIFGKSADGRIAVANQIVLLPYLLSQYLVWHLQRAFLKVPAYHSLTDQVRMGRRLLSSECPDDVIHVVDLTCEFREPTRLRSRMYHWFPILDGDAPTPDQLREWATHVAQLTGPVYIHCAAGHGRTALLAAALLHVKGLARSPEEAFALVKSFRSGVRLNDVQWRVLRELFADDQ